MTRSHWHFEGMNWKDEGSVKSIVELYIERIFEQEAMEGRLPLMLDIIDFNCPN